jgi:Flp pilus assembly protein TadB
VAKWFFIGFAAAAAVAAYMFWFRRSNEVGERFDSLASKARDYTSSALDRASQIKESAVSTASDQADRARDTVNA